MFRAVRINNFKSIRNLEFAAQRVNVFIGEPNTGKSNIVEALAVFSEGIYEREIIHEVLRFKRPSDLFYDHDLTETISVDADGEHWSLAFQSPHFVGRFASVQEPTPGVRKTSVQPEDAFTLDHQGQLLLGSIPGLPAKYYRFKSLSDFPGAQPGALKAPFGTNLVALLSTNKRLRRLVGDLFRQRGFRLVIAPENNEIVLAKEVDEQLYNFSYLTVSETLRRLVFFMAALETNQNSVLLLDEPEANTFPFYTTYLAERIALDESNQFFLTTHNPYVLGAIVGKTPMKELGVFVTAMEDFRTVLKPVSEEGLSRILDYGPDAFLNLDRLAAA